jgi:hypothetical protein
VIPGVDYKWKLIQVPGVTHYSFGQHENGDVELWAAGQAGWYSLKPADSYARIFYEMLEAVNLWYFVVDTCTMRKRTSAQDLITQYGTVHKLAAAKAKERVYKHRNFLLSQMSKGAEGPKWDSTPIYQALPHLPALQIRASGPSASHAVPSKTRVNRLKDAEQPDSPDESSKASSRPRRPGRKRAAPPPEPEAERSKMSRKEPPELPPSRKEHDKARVNALWRFIQKTTEDTKPGKPSKLTFDLYARLVYSTFEFHTETEAANYIRFYAADLVSKMQHRDTPRFAWASSTFYSELLIAKIAPIVRNKMAKLSLRRRDAPLLDDVEMESDEPEEETESEEEQIIVSLAKGGKGHHTRGGLRVKTGKGPGKGKGEGKDKRYVRVVEEEEDEEEETVSVGSKRKAHDIDEPQLRKRSRRNAPIDPTKSPPSPSDIEDDEEAEVEDDADELDELALPLRPNITHSYSSPEVEDTHLALVAEPVLSSTPNEPGDVWRCSRDNCNHIVYGASGEVGRILIQEHVDEHDEKIRYVISEKSLTNLPVG